MHLIVSGQSISVADNVQLVSGSVGEYITTFDFSADWDGYAKTAVFEPTGGEAREAVLVDDACLIPWEVLQAECSLRIGCYGINGDKRKPTVYTPSRLVFRGAEQASASVEPTPDVYSQILELASNTKEIAQSVRNDADVGAFDGVQGPPGPQGEPGSDAAVTAENIQSALGYTPAKPDGVYELIETITLTEAVNSVERTTEPDGTPYAFKAVYITMKAVAPSVSYQPRLWAMYNNVYLSGQTSTPGNISTEYDSYCTSITELINGMWQNKSVMPQKGNSWTGTFNSTVGYNPIMARDAPICNRVIIQKSSFLAWEIGCVFKIYGVRA